MIASHRQGKAPKHCRVPSTHSVMLEKESSDSPSAVRICYFMFSKGQKQCFYCILTCSQVSESYASNGGNHPIKGSIGVIIEYDCALSHDF